jgi:hypothetical protein
MDDSERIAAAEGHGYFDVKVLDGKVCGLLRLAFTTGLIVDIGKYGYNCRYCYPRHGDAVEALAAWDGKGDPPGNWIKRKGGGGDVENPNYEPE